MIVLEKLKARFGKRLILDNISATFHEGTINAITGKSGTGKTTLLSIISGLHNPDEGRVFFENQNILKWGDVRRSHYRNREIGFIFQFFNLLPDMNSFQNIIYPARVNMFHDRMEIDRYANELIDQLEIRDITQNYPGTLSGGERQRVAIARSIINRPRIILADEPTGNLDELSAVTTLDLFKSLRDKQGMTMIIVTHDKRIVDIADTHYDLKDGVLTCLKGAKVKGNIKRNLAKMKAPVKKKSASRQK